MLAAVVGAVAKRGEKPYWLAHTRGGQTVFLNENLEDVETLVGDLRSAARASTRESVDAGGVAASR